MRELYWAATGYPSYKTEHGRRNTAGNARAQAQSRNRRGRKKTIPRECIADELTAWRWVGLQLSMQRGARYIILCTAVHDLSKTPARKKREIAAATHQIPVTIIAHLIDHFRALLWRHASAVHLQIIKCEGEPFLPFLAHHERTHVLVIITKQGCHGPARTPLSLPLSLPSLLRFISVGPQNYLVVLSTSQLYIGSAVPSFATFLSRCYVLQCKGVPQVYAVWLQDIGNRSIEPKRDALGSTHT